MCDGPGLGSMFVWGVYRVHGRSVLAGLGVRLGAFKVVSNFIFVLDVPKVSVGLADFTLVRNQTFLTPKVISSAKCRL